MEWYDGAEQARLYKRLRWRLPVCVLFTSSRVLPARYTNGTTIDAAC